MTHEKTLGAAHFFEPLSAEAMRTAYIQTDVKEQRSECHGSRLLTGGLTVLD